MASYAQRIERYIASHPGATKAEARGHGSTPEHPGQGFGKERYADYHERRANAEAHVNELKKDAYGNLPNFNEKHSEAATSRMSIGALEKSAGFDTLDDFEDYYEGDIDDGYGYYH